ncbi:unnamed protein product [Zymoseptoria tritici ST99CH_1A5]|uniref:DUF1750-domain-containing protein n=1 Tax=Zymoseptoria tritici ST99CH_1A5 TaxID=1276529 RepID=A0A1Y6LPM9_ZYMTR|nr:unnamed protein product [Zymoseptoria tritici ST99CH_1A5]
MQNPLQGVAAQLQPHMHLISHHRFPLLAQLPVEQAYRYLLDAPSIVKQVAPMSWTYTTAPSDGTMWLEWIPVEKTDQPFPSDGYAWADPEATYRHELNGYTVEMRVHTMGFRPGVDQMASHARTRYHFVAKNPSVNAPPPDSALWLVHYHQAERMLPANQLQIAPQVQQILAQRRWLESLGRLELKEFMLHDRNNWPTVNLPGAAQMQQPGQPGAYGANSLAAMQMNQNRYPQQHYPQQSGNPREAKKPRLEGPRGSIPGASEAVPDATLELEEDTSLGDFFDHLTQRDISVARYMQHHRWMEEVFSSPYSSHSIVPTDLGLGLMGELKGLTEGILEPPSLDFVDRPDTKPLKAKEAQPFTNLKQEQVEEFGKRVEKHLEEGRAEIERMKAEHAAKMQDWKKVKALTQAEKRLKYATLQDTEDEVAVFRLEEPATNGQNEGASKEHVDDVVKDVESALKVKVTAHDDATRIARGGFKERKEPTYIYTQQDTSMDGMDSAQQQSGSVMNGGGGESATYHEDPMANSQNATTAQNSSNPPQQAQPAQSQPQPAASAPQTQQNGNNNANNDVLGDLPDLDMDNDALMQDMVMDVDDSNLEFDESALGLGETGNAGVPARAPAAPSQPAEQAATSQAPAAGTSAATTASAAGPTSATSAPQTATTQPATTQPQAESSNTANAPTADNSAAASGEAGGDSMFADTFGDLANLEGEELLDFDAGLDDSAFGEALHGMGGGDE